MNYVKIIVCVVIPMLSGVLPRIQVLSSSTEDSLIVVSHRLNSVATRSILPRATKNTNDVHLHITNAIRVKVKKRKKKKSWF